MSSDNLVSPYITNFTGGEVTELVDGRQDLSRYFNSAKYLQNMQIFPHGAAITRPGTRWVAEVKDSTKKVRLVRFKFSVGQAFCLEFGNLYIRFYYQDGQVQGGNGAELVQNPHFMSTNNWTRGTGWSISAGQSPNVGTASKSAGTGSSLSESITLTQGTSYFVAYNITALSAGTVMITLNGTSGVVRTAPGTYGEIIVAGASGGLAIVGDSTTVCTVKDISCKPSGIMEIVSPYTSDQIFDLKFAQSADVIYITHGAVATQKLARYANTNWDIAAPAWVSPHADWVSSNYPCACSFFEQRLVLSGCPNQPLKHYMSRSGSFEDFTTGTADDNALVYTQTSEDPIRWLLDHTVLIVGTYGSLWEAGASSGNNPITPTNVRMQCDTNFGASGVQGLLIGYAIVYVGRSGLKVMQQTFDVYSNGMIAQDITLMARHITRPGLLDICWAQDPDATLWVVRADGVLLSGTYYPPEKVMAWSRHVTDGQYESVCSIPTATRDEVWVSVNRTINGVTKRFIEFFEVMLPEGATSVDLSNAFQVDSGLTYSGSPTTTLSGLGHLEGKTVSVLADGAVQNQKVVTGGAITLDVAASTVQVGLPYHCELQPMQIDIPSQGDTAQGKMKRIHSIIVRFFQTVGGMVGTSDTSLEGLTWHTATDKMDTAVQLFTGDKKFRMKGGYVRQANIVITQDDPVPLCVVSIMPQLTINDQ